MATVLVTGATGRVGSALLPLLVGRGDTVLAVTRRPEAAEALLEAGAEPIIADMTDPAVLAPALKRADCLFLATADAPDQDRIEARLIEAARAAGAAQVVKLSAQSAGLDPPVSFGTLHRRAEQALQGSGLAYTILRPVFFQQSLLLFAPDIAAKGRFIAPAGNGRIAMVDVGDIARSAAAVIGSDAHAGRTYTLTGPSALSFAEIAAYLSERLDRTVKFTSPPGFIARLVLPLATGMPRWQSNLVVDLFAAQKRGAQAPVSGDVEALTGQAAQSIEAFLDAHLEAFRRR